MALVDLTNLTDVELDAIGDDDVRVEKHRRDNLTNMPLAKAKADDGVKAFPKTALAVDIIQDTIDGAVVVVDTGGNGELMAVLLGAGGKYLPPTNEGDSITMVRIVADLAVKEGGAFEQMEALL